MKPCDIIIRAQEIVRQRAPLYKDPRFIAVAGALAAKKLLFFDQRYPAPKKKISIADILWVGENLEPRVLEVFPAALLRFPSLFKAAKKLPHDLADLINCLKKQSSAGPLWRNIPYERLLFWTNASVADGRGVPLNQRKIVRSYRILPSSAKALAQIAQERETNCSAALDWLLSSLKPQS